MTKLSTPKATAAVTGAGELEMPSDTDLFGNPTKPRTATGSTGTPAASASGTAEPLVVHWTERMLFDGGGNFALFQGGVRADKGANTLTAQRLWIYFADPPPNPADTAVAAAPPKDKSAAAGGGLLGSSAAKRIIRVLAEEKVHAVQLQQASDKAVQSAMDLTGDNLSYVEEVKEGDIIKEAKKVYINGPGRLHILSREAPRRGEAPASLAPAGVAAAWQGTLPDGYSRIDVAWAEAMVYQPSGTSRAYFKGAIDASIVGRQAMGAESGAGARRAVSTTRVKSNELNLTFVPKAPALTGTGSAGGVAAVTPTTSAGPGAQDNLNLDKMVADGKVSLWIDEHRGTAERVLYQRDPELFRLYRGEDDWARLWKFDEARQRYDEVAARTITYKPATRETNMVDQQTLIISPSTEPAPKLAPGRAVTPEKTPKPATH
jgi:hypothetical protein